MTNEERDDLLIRLDERTKLMIAWQSDHGRKHFRHDLVIYGALIGAILSLALLV